MRVFLSAMIQIRTAEVYVDHLKIVSVGNLGVSHS